MHTEAYHPGELLSFYRGKRVFITGHTGFKGSWLCRILTLSGAEVTGYSLDPPTDPNLFDLARTGSRVRDLRGDVRDMEKLFRAFQEARPEIVFHLAAQPIVRESYREPRLTYETNVMGTVNLMECVRMTPGIRSVVNVTTDKVYQNREWCWGYREDEPLDGFDPYSNSKSCSELVTHCYINSFFGGPDAPAVSTARAGNVIGGGDFAKDRIIPDCIRAVTAGERIRVRNPFSTRPFQHVLEPLAAYLLIARRQYEDRGYAGCYNVGPEEADCLPTGELTALFCRCWGEGAAWESRAEENAPHEANYLKLDCSKMKSTFGWKPRWHMDTCMEMVCRFSRVLLSGGDIGVEMDREIRAFFS